MRVTWPRAFRRHPPLDVTLLGYPFRSTGRAENLKSTFRALRAAGVEPKVFDLDRGLHGEIDESEIRSRLVPRLEPGGIRIYHCNGNLEADLAIRVVDERAQGAFAAGYNIIHPAWELPRYPLSWAQSLNRYDEVWAITRFVYDSLRECITVPLQSYPDACQPQISSQLTRKQLGLPEDDFLVLSFFDYWSYAARKNPLAAIEAFASVIKARPNAPLRLVMKTNHAPTDAGSAPVRAAMAELGHAGILIERTMTDNEVKNLIALSDCLISLHRSEGFGRGPAEAMFLGKPVIATGWSGIWTI